MHKRLDFEERQQAQRLMAAILEDPEAAAYELISLRSEQVCHEADHRYLTEYRQAYGEDR